MNPLMLLALIISLSFGHAEAKTTKTKKATPQACCVQDGGIYFCDAVTKRDVCSDGSVSKTCGCKSTDVYSDACSVGALYNTLETKKAAHEDVTKLEKKTWWTQCAPWTRSSVYSLMKKRT